MRDTYVPVTAWRDLSAAKLWGASYTIPENGEDKLYAGNNTHKHSNKEDQIKWSMHRSNIRAEAEHSLCRSPLKPNVCTHSCKNTTKSLSCLKSMARLLYRTFGSHLTETKSLSAPPTLGSKQQSSKRLTLQESYPFIALQSFHILNHISSLQKTKD